MENESARDRAIQRLTAEKLRNAGKAAADLCPDAEVLAAYVERTLAPRERLSCETHLASCVGCQEQVAALVRLREAEQPADVRPVPAPSRLAWLTGLRWAWAAPVLVALVIGGIWYSGEYRRYTHTPQEKASKILAPAVESAPQEASQNAETQDILVPLPRKPEKGLPQGGEIGKLAPGAQSESAKAPEPPSLGKASQRGEPAPAAAPLPGTEQGAIISPGQRSRLATPAPANLPAASIEERRNGLSVAPSVAKPGNESAADNMGIAPSNATPKQAAPGEPGVELGQVSSGGHYEAKKKAAAERSLQVVAPSVASGLTSFDVGRPVGRISAVRKEGSWRVGPRGLIQRAGPDGRWINQPSGVDADLFAIDFPANSVGWIVGQAGTILRTTDGGDTWVRLASPTSEDLVRVTGQGESTARVETRTGRVLLTTDAGKTWIEQRR